MFYYCEMESTGMRDRLLQDFGVLSMIVGAIAIWYAFQRQMCTMGGGGTNSCSPNIVYLISGIFVALIGFALFVVLYRRQSDSLENTGD